MPEQVNYQAAAMAALQSEAPAVLAPEATAAPAAPAPVEAAPAQPEAPKAPVAPTEDVPAGAPDAVKKSFEKLAAKNAEIRAREEKLRGLEAIASKFNENSIQALIKAAQASDPVSALGALGFTHADYVQSMTMGRPQQAQPQAPKAQQPDDVVAVLQQQVQQLQQRLDGEAASKGRARALERMEAVAKTGKYEFASAVEGATEKALAVFEDYIAKNGAPAPAEVEGLFDAALKHVDEQLRVEAQRWEKVLTARQKPATTQVGQTAPALQSSSPGQRTLSNNLASAAPALPAQAAKTKGDYHLAALEILKRGVTQ